MINIIIIEDELNSQEILQQLLEEFCTDVKIVGVASNVQTGIQLIKERHPDIVFLDIEMPGGNGFELLKAFDPIPFKVIFVTGYDQYAIQAIRFSALDYLLKPVNIDELQASVAKAIDQQKLDRTNLENVEHNLSNKAKTPNRLVLSNDRERLFVNLNEVLYVEAQGSYVNFFLEGTRRQMATRSLAHYEDLLPPDQFFRTHKSYIVNCDKVVSIKTGRGGVINLKDGFSVPIAIRRKSTFIHLLSQREDHVQ